MQRAKCLESLVVGDENAQGQLPRVKRRESNCNSKTVAHGNDAGGRVSAMHRIRSPVEFFFVLHLTMLCAVCRGPLKDLSCPFGGFILDNIGTAF